MSSRPRAWRSASFSIARKTSGSWFFSELWEFCIFFDDLLYSFFDQGAAFGINLRRLAHRILDVGLPEPGLLQEKVEFLPVIGIKAFKHRQMIGGHGENNIRPTDEIHVDKRRFMLDVPDPINGQRLTRIGRQMDIGLGGRAAGTSSPVFEMQTSGF